MSKKYIRIKAKIHIYGSECKINVQENWQDIFEDITDVIGMISEINNVISIDADYDTSFFVTLNVTGEGVMDYFEGNRLEPSDFDIKTDLDNIEFLLKKKLNFAKFTVKVNFEEIRDL